MIIDAILVTKSRFTSDLREWIEWHLDRCGFDKIYLVDNDSECDVESLIKEFGDRISYQKVSGFCRQLKIYDKIINEVSTADWIMPIDDDEFLDLGPYRDVKEFIQHYSEIYPNEHMFAIRWKHLFPKEFHSERNGMKVLDYCTEENDVLADLFRLGDRGIKCIIKRDGKVHYLELHESPVKNHVPTHTKCEYARSLVGEICNYNVCYTTSGEDVRLLHCKYKGYNEWTYKVKNFPYVSDKVPRVRDREVKFNKILELLK
jgi:hypothetical protein